MQNQYARHRGDLPFVYPATAPREKNKYVPLEKRDDWEEIKQRIEVLPDSVPTKEGSSLSQIIWRRTEK